MAHIGSLPYSRTARFFVETVGRSVRRGELSGLFLRKVLEVLKHKQIILVAVWLLAVGLGLHTLLRYKAKAGNAGQPPSTWPSNTLVSSPLHKPLLVMFAHPRCPCTKASLGELEQLVARAQNQFDATIAFYTPRGGSKACSNSALVREARSIPGVRVQFDNDGNLAKRFGIETSGHTLVYSPDGKLLFSGGITGSRGHLGDNTGFAAVQAIISNHSSLLAPTTTPVFGCELFDRCTRNEIAESH